EWRMARCHFIKHHAETPNVGAFINPDTVGTRLFGRHVTNCSQYRPQVGLSERHRFCLVLRRPESFRGCEGWFGEGGFGNLCNAKIEHLHVAVRSEHDVLRLDVAMDNTSVMGGNKRTGHLDGDVNSLA